MSWREFIAEMAGHLAWPLLALLFLLIFLRPLKGLIEAIENWEGFGQRITFGRRLERAAKQAQVEGVREFGVTPAVARARLATNASPSPASVTHTQTDPQSTVLGSWERLEESIRALIEAAWREYERQGIEQLHRADQLDDLMNLATADLFPLQVVDTVRELRQLRDQVALGVHEVKPNEAEQYAATVEVFAKNFRDLTASITSMAADSPPEEPRVP